MRIVEIKTTHSAMQSMCTVFPALKYRIHFVVDISLRCAGSLNTPAFSGYMTTSSIVVAVTNPTNWERGSTSLVAHLTF